ncbi:MAG TPA: response regulator [Candidatus Kapabacteria bacterium]|nr:response regulator [Candidatus Kapabacteria bacterium]
MTTIPALLLIDDDSLFLQTLGRSLQRRGTEVATARDGTSALQILQHKRFDLILLDLNLDGESGLKLLQQILALQPDARVVMLTAYASVATAVDAIKRGAENYLCKPVTAADILALLQDDADNTTDTNPLQENPLSVDRLEWEHLQRVLLEHNGNISATARALNMHRRTLQRKLQKRPVSK